MAEKGYHRWPLMRNVYDDNGRPAWECLKCHTVLSVRAGNKTCQIPDERSEQSVPA